MKTFAVIGNPVAHSQSPALHQMFAAELGIELSYQRQCATHNNFEQVVTQFFDNGGSGLNITAPFKERAFRFADCVSDRAQQSRSVNTLWKNGDSYWGDTTDGVGLVRDIKEGYQQILTNKRILVLGAGGAVRAVLPDLLAEHPMQLLLFNRTDEKAQALVDNYQTTVLAAINQSFIGNHVDVVINGTSASLSGELPVMPQFRLSSETFCYDMAYTDQLTAFNQWCLDQGALTVADGRGMLQQQAAESFYRWHGVRPIVKKL